MTNRSRNQDGADRGKSNTRGKKAGEGRSESRSDSRDKKPHTAKSSDSRKPGQKVEKKFYKPKHAIKNPSFQKTRVDDGSIRLNKYLSNAGVSSRREADELIKSGMVEVNGKIVKEMGYKVFDVDVIKYAGEKIKSEKPVYILLNKPKDYTTNVRANSTRNVFSLLNGSGKHNAAPVGKLDRNTSGLIILTNDGDLGKKLTQKKTTAKQLYHVHLDKNIKPEHIAKSLEGVDLEEGRIQVNEMEMVNDGKDKKQVGLEVQGTKDSAVRSLFESFGYNVLKMDRVVFAGLSKKDLTRGKWRFITEKELVNLKMLK